MRGSPTGGRERGGECGVRGSDAAAPAINRRKRHHRSGVKRVDTAAEH